jgi:hypothetical protein
MITGKWKPGLCTKCHGTINNNGHKCNLQKIAYYERIIEDDRLLEDLEAKERPYGQRIQDGFRMVDRDFEMDEDDIVEDEDWEQFGINRTNNP